MYVLTLIMVLHLKSFKFYVSKFSSFLLIVDFAVMWTSSTFIVIENIHFLLSVYSVLKFNSLKNLKN